MRQAVIIIHGIGEQRPMDTLRNFARTMVGEKIRNKPDKMSSLFELRRLQVPGTRTQPLTDMYEYYWAHHMRDSTFRVLISWFKTLLFRLPKNVSERLRGYYYILWLLIFSLSFFIYGAVIAAMSADYSKLLCLIVATLALLIFDYNVLRIAYGVIDDAARYLNPHPDNIAQRNKIREEGLKLLDTLHNSKKYSRIIIVGHSLGSVIAYDLIRLYWSSLEVQAPNESMKQIVLKAFSQRCTDIFNDEKLSEKAKASEYHKLQLQMWEELRKCGWPWLITDFITAGSPLTHASMLLADDREEFSIRTDEGEFPTCPPLQTHDIYYRMDYSTEQGTRSVFRPTHLVPFMCTRWTNLYFPHKYFIVGDLVGGPLRPLFGGGVRDIPVDLKGYRGFLFSHTKYWEYGVGQYKVGDRKHPTQELKNSLQLDCLQGNMEWPNP
jgi:hypothetical protein